MYWHFVAIDGVIRNQMYLCCWAVRHTCTDMNAICRDVKPTNQGMQYRMRFWLWESIVFTAFPYICLQTILETVQERIFPWSCPFIIHNHTVKETVHLCCSSIGNCVAKYRFWEEGATSGIYAVMNLTQYFMTKDRQGSWLQIQRSGIDSRSFQIFWEVVGLERGPLSLVSTTEELLGRKVAAAVNKTEITALGICSADHATPSISKSRH
jgi:hypothetical protein